MGPSQTVQRAFDLLLDKDMSGDWRDCWNPAIAAELPGGGLVTA
ncbi:hypothetical protein ABT008_12555 [Micromonospora sp. NPDC002389]